MEEKSKNLRGLLTATLQGESRKTQVGPKVKKATEDLGGRRKTPLSGSRRAQETLVQLVYEVQRKTP